MKYLKVWTNFREVIGTLEFDEIGRLFVMMLDYAEDGVEPQDFPGNEKYIWPVAKRDIDLLAEFNQKQRENGLKGGRPRTQENPEKPKETQNNPNEPNENQKSLKEKKRKETEIKESERSFISEADAEAVQSDHDRILDAALDAGFKSSNAEKAGLLNLYAVYGLEKMLNGISECMKHSAPNLAYLEAVLKGTGKKAGYDQRDYAGEQEKALDRMMSDSWGVGEA